MNTYKNKLIVLRGNSGSGKSVVARKLRITSVNKDLKRKVALVDQDHFRRVAFFDKDGQYGDDELLYQIVELALRHEYDVILEGILSMRRYSNMLQDFAAMCPNNYFYYFDIPFEETLRRHNTKPNAGEFGEKEMREWWKEKDLTGFEGEQVIGADSTIEQTVQRILVDTGL